MSSLRTTTRRSVGLFLLAGAASGVIALANAGSASADPNSLYVPSVPSRNADIVMLNPQPLPPGPDHVMLNPQPLPPRVDLSRRAILSRLAF